MRWTKHQLYRHARFLDCFIEVVKIQFAGPDYIKLRVKWWNQGFTGNPWILDENTVTIQRKDYKDWSVIKKLRGGSHVI